MSDRVTGWSEVETIDRDDAGALPRMNVSVKLSALDSHFSPVDTAGTTERVLGRLRPILRLAREQHAFVHVDLEQYHTSQLTQDIFRRVLMEDEFRDSGPALQQQRLPESRRGASPANSAS